MQFGFYRNWLDLALHKKMPEAFGKIGLMRGVKHLAAAGLIQGLLAGVYVMVSAGNGIDSLVVITLATIIGYVLGTLVFAALLSGIVKAFGGKGNHEQYIGLIAFISAAVAGTWFAALGVVSILGTMAGLGESTLLATGLLGLLVSVYWLYQIARATKSVHNMEKWKTVILVLVVAVVLGLAFQSVFPAT